MAKFTGTIRRNDLEGGFFELVTEAGDTYRLEGDAKFEAGKRVHVHGQVESAGFGLHMTGTPALQVQRVEPA